MRMVRLAAALAAGVLLSCSLSVHAAPVRMPDGGVFDADYYAAAYPDVAAACGNDANTMYQHYLNSGRNEGRLPYDPADEAAAQAAANNVPDIPNSIHSRPGTFDYILRWPDANVRQYMVQQFKAKSANKTITYSQGGDRTSFLTNYINADFDASAVRGGAADCSSTVCAIVKAAGYHFDIPQLATLNETYWTGNMLEPFQAAGFQLIDCRTITYKDALPGDILVDLDRHTQIHY